ncbi:hypothetical protein BJY59DRAFT_687917 [Rhodotorula toruloides]
MEEGGWRSEGKGEEREEVWWSSASRRVLSSEPRRLPFHLRGSARIANCAFAVDAKPDLAVPADASSPLDHSGRKLSAICLLQSLPLASLLKDTKLHLVYRALQRRMPGLAELAAGNDSRFVHHREQANATLPQRDTASRRLEQSNEWGRGPWSERDAQGSRRDGRRESLMLECRRTTSSPR